MRTTSVLDVFTLTLEHCREAAGTDDESEHLMPELLLWLCDVLSKGHREVLRRCEVFDVDPFFAHGNERQDLSPAAWENLSEEDGRRIRSLQRR